MLYPMMILAAVSVIVFSIVGIATMSGQVPNALPAAQQSGEPARVEGGGEAPRGKAPGESRAPADRLVADEGRPPISRHVEVAANCSNCGIIESIREIETKGQGTGLGMAVGGVAGGLLGNQIGHGGGRTAATILGAAGGAYVGNEVERNTKRGSAYRITLRMEDGTYRTITQRSHPGYGLGERVKVVNGAIVARG